MERQGIEPDTVVFTLLVRALCDGRASADGPKIDRARAIVERMEATGPRARPNAVTYNALLAGSLLHAEMHGGASTSAKSGTTPSVEHSHRAALEVFDQMLSRRVSPTRTTFTHLARYAAVPNATATTATADGAANEHTPATPGTVSSRNGAEEGPSPERVGAPLSDRLDFLLTVVDLFERNRRRLNHDVYLAILNLCAAVPGRDDAARTLISERREALAAGERGVFELRKARLREVDDLEEQFGFERLRRAATV